MNQYNKIIFVCTGNTCRSPMAETIYKSLDTSSGISVISRGLVVLFPEPSNPKANMVLSNHNLRMEEHIATQLNKTDLEEKTLILTMTEKQKKSIIDQYGEGMDIYTLKEFIGESGDVTDPYGGTLVDYEECYVELARLIKKTVYKLNEEVSI